MSMPKNLQDVLQESREAINYRVKSLEETMSSSPLPKFPTGPDGDVEDLYRAIWDNRAEAAGKIMSELCRPNVTLTGKQKHPGVIDVESSTPLGKQ